MAIVAKNLALTPTFELGSVGGWTATGATLSVSTDKSGLGTKSMKVTATAAGTVVITGTASPVLNSGGYTAYAGAAAYMATGGTGYDGVNYGADFLNSSGGLVQRVFPSSGAVGLTSTMTRYQGGYLSCWASGVTQIRPVFTWYANNAGDSIYIDGITLVQYYEGTMLYTPWGAGNTIPDIIGSKAAASNITYSWAGTAEASYSLATSSAMVNAPMTLTRGTSASITGSGFVPNTSVKLRLAADAMGSGTGQPGFTTVTADSSGAFSYTWTSVVGDQGAAWVAAQPTAGWGAITPSLVKSQVVGEPTKNWFINPSFRASDGTARNLFNLCPNPTPTLDLTGWDAVGSATVTRSTAAKIVGISHGARVVSGASTDGIALPYPSTYSQWNGLGYSAYVRAVTDCTLKISGMPLGATFTVSNTAAGWGDGGWGETATFASGDTITLTAGQVIRARILPRANYPYPTVPYGCRAKITGTGTFDVDGVWVGMGVADGEYPGGQAPGTAPFFCGATPSDADFTYEWIGTPYASASARRGKTAYGILGAEGWLPGDNTALGTGADDYNYTHTHTRTGGETTLALRTKQWFSNGSITVANASGGTAAADLGLTVGKSYLLSMDIIMDYWAVLSGYAYDGSNGNEFWTVFENATAASTQPKISIPGRTRLYSPFNVDTGTEKIILGVPGYMGWLLGEVEISKAMLTETTIYAINNDGTWASPVDLTNTGIVPGSDVLLSISSAGPGVDTPYAIEAQVGGVWTEAGSLTVGADDWEMTNQTIVTIPAGATGIRLVGDASSTDGFAVTDAPPDYFDGSMTAADGWTYSWEGTPNASPSLRAAGTTPTITAQIFVGGVAKSVAEMRAVKGGVLTPVSQIGI